VFMDEQKKGGALYLIKERGNATNKGRSSELQEFRLKNWRAVLDFLPLAFSWPLLTNTPSQRIDGGNSRTESPGTFATFRMPPK
jgi:hypothetical protein